MSPAYDAWLERPYDVGRDEEPAEPLERDCAPIYGGGLELVEEYDPFGPDELVLVDHSQSWFWWSWRPLR